MDLEILNQIFLAAGLIPDLFVGKSACHCTETYVKGRGLDKRQSTRCNNDLHFKNSPELGIVEQGIRFHFYYLKIKKNRKCPALKNTLNSLFIMAL